MAEGAPRSVEVSAPLEADQVTGVDVAVYEMVAPHDDSEDGGEGTAGLRDPLPDLSSGRVRMANGGVVHGEIVPAIVPLKEYL